MDYLITEGYPSAAEKFAMEANLGPRDDDTFINERVQIRDSIHRGDLQQAIELINELNPEVSRSDLPPLHLPCYDYIRFHAPLIVLRGFDESKNTFSPQYDYRSNNRILVNLDFRIHADIRQTNSCLTETRSCTSHYCDCN